MLKLSSSKTVADIKDYKYKQQILTKNTAIRPESPDNMDLTSKL